MILSVCLSVVPIQSTSLWKNESELNTRFSQKKKKTNKGKLSSMHPFPSLFNLAPMMSNGKWRQGNPFRAVLLHEIGRAVFRMKFS